MIRVNQVKIGIFEDKKEIKKQLSKKLRISIKDIIEYKIFKESIDARRKDIKFVYSIDVNVKNEKNILKKGKFNKSPDYEYKNVKSNLDKNIKPIIVGSGPAGLFSALILAQSGYKPIILERGEKVDKRVEKINNFWKNGILDEDSNVQFGEGGAGTFSDGKLTSRIKDPRSRKVLKEFINVGAPEEIIYKKYPHIGTDNLRGVVVKLREKIISLGGEFRFNNKVTDLIIEKDSIKGVIINKKTKLMSKIVVLAIGHSSRELFERLNSLKVKIESKPFAIGVRIEHPQSMIDINQYGSSEISKKLGSAEYRLTHNKGDRGVYSFCMCPGGSVVASSSEKGTVVTNGMSEYKRDKENANSAILVTVTPKDFGLDNPLSGMFFQRELEKKAFKLGGGNYNAPATLVGELLSDYKKTVLKQKIEPSYKPGVKFVNFNELLPEYIINPIKEALKYFGSRIEGFDRDDAIITGIETRSSSPIRILREEISLESVNVKGLFPCGEGAGYAGGIMSSAVDGIKVAEKIMEK